LIQARALPRAAFFVPLQSGHGALEDSSDPELSAYASRALQPSGSDYPNVATVNESRRSFPAAGSWSPTSPPNADIGSTGIGDIRLSAQHIFDILRVHQINLKTSIHFLLHVFVSSWQSSLYKRVGRATSRVIPYEGGA
jgi:hypothetical protein